MINRSSEGFTFWFAGILEGEASFGAGIPSKPNYPYISIESTDEDVIKEIAQYAGLRYCKPTVRQDHWKQSYKVLIRGQKAKDLMTKIFPHMSKRRQEQLRIILGV